MGFDITTAINVTNVMFLDVKTMLFGRQASNFGRKYFMSFHNRSTRSLEDGGRKSSEMWVSIFQTTRWHILEGKYTKLITLFSNNYII
jgi:hypothetical protein